MSLTYAQLDLVENLSRPSFCKLRDSPPAFAGGCRRPAARFGWRLPRAAG